MHLRLSVLAVVGLVSSAHADPWKPSAGHVQIPLWPGAPPDGAPTGPETSTTGHGTYGVIIAAAHVSKPTMTVYAATGANTGAAIVVFPGGGYKELAMDLEGTELCDWLSPKGITCVVLKYRVPDSGPHWDDSCKCQAFPKAPWALQDAQRAISILRARAAEWHVDPHKIGVMGFSAGGHLVAHVSTHLARSYPRIDAIDDQSSRPDFAIPLYPGHLWIDESKLELHPHIQVTAQTPPTLIVQATDDDVDNVNNSVVYYRALVAAHVPVEMHLFAHGGHAFGLRKPTEPVGAWPRLVETWLGSIGMIGKKP
jgi:acetyl esterase/lipase